LLSSRMCYCILPADSCQPISQQDIEITATYLLKQHGFLGTNPLLLRLY
jgi:hypothetical protein